MSALLSVAGCGKTDEGPGSAGGGNASGDGDDGGDGDGSGTGARSGDGDGDGGSTGSGSTGSGASRSGGAGGGGTDGAGGSPDLPPTDTRLGACRHYFLTQCSRVSSCRRADGLPDLEMCHDLAVDICPDAFFSDGSAQTIESALACADEWESFSCEDLYEGRVPDCSVLPGSRDDGESCLYGSQCSGTCLFDSEDCGTCRPYSTDGTCSDELACPGFASCDEGVCVPAVDEPTVLDPAPELGEPCTNRCAGEAICVIISLVNDESICELPPESGEDCASSLEGGGFGKLSCADGLLCALDETCQPPPPAGDPCALDVDDELHCEDGSFCTTDEICEQPAGPGQPCVFPADASEGECQPGQDCVDGTCILTLGWGETGCSVDGQVCEQGTRCDEDVCVIDDELRKFDEVCGQ